MSASWGWLWGPSDGTLMRVLGLVVAMNAAAVFLVPGVLGYPSGGMFLIEALPIFAVGATIGALAAIPTLLAARHRFGLVASGVLVLALGALALANAELWVLCVASV